MRTRRLPLVEHLAHRGGLRGLELHARLLRRIEGLRVVALHEGHAEQRADRVTHAPVVPCVRTEPRGVGRVIRQRRRDLRRHRERRRQRVHAPHDRARHLGLPLERRVHMIVHEPPARGALGAEVTEALGHVAEHRTVRLRRVADGLFGQARGSPRHRVQITRLQEGLARPAQIARPSQGATQPEVRKCAVRRELDHGAMLGHQRTERILEAAARLQLLQGILGLPHRLAQRGELLLHAGPTGVVLAKRSHAGLVAGGGAHDRRHACGLHGLEHAAEMRAKVPCGGLAQGRVRGQDGLADHLLHQRLALIRAAIGQLVEGLHQRQAARCTQQRQRPSGRPARGVDRGRSIGAEELVVAHVEHEQVGLKRRRLLHLIDQREARDGGGAEIDHLHPRARPRIGQHGLQEGAHRQVRRLRIALRSRLADQKDAHGARGLGHDERGRFGVAGAFRIREEVRLEGAVLD